MADILRSEFYRTSKIKSIYIAPVLIVLLLIVTFAVFDAFAGQFDGAEIPQGILNLSGKGFIVQALSNSMATTFLAIIVSILVAGSFTNGAVRTYVTRGANRISLYFSKLITAFTVAAALSLFCFFVSWILSLVFGYSVNSSDIPLILESMAIQLLVIFGFASLYTFFAFLIRSTGGTIGLSIALIIFVGIAQGLIAILAGLSGNDWISDLLQIFLSTQLSTAMGVGALETWQYLCVTLIPLAYIAVPTALGIWSFKIRDIK